MLRRAQSTSEKMIKVDQVGENGAVNIYLAQRRAAKFRAPHLVQEINRFIIHEQTHREIFKQYLSQRGIRKCVSYHLGGIGGYALGLVTGLLGPSAITATTYAVESVVLSHLETQMAYLKIHDLQAYDCVSKIYADEKEHLDLAKDKLDQNNKFTPVLIRIIKFSTEILIRFGMR